MILRRESVASSTDEPRTETLLISDQENRNLSDPRKRQKVSLIAIIRIEYIHLKIA